MKMIIHDDIGEHRAFAYSTQDMLDTVARICNKHAEKVRILLQKSGDYTHVHVKARDTDG